MLLAVMLVLLHVDLDAAPHVSLGHGHCVQEQIARVKDRLLSVLSFLHGDKVSKNSASGSAGLGLPVEIKSDPPALLCSGGVWLPGI